MKTSKYDGTFAEEMPAKEKRQAIALGLAISGALLKPGQTRTHREIAAFCGCHWNMIWMIEQKALKKLRHPTRARRLTDEYRPQQQ